MQGRVFGLMRSLYSSCYPIGMALFGPLADTIPLKWIMVMLNELIEKIEVFNAEKIDGVWEQRLRIHYNCVGTIEIPTVLPLPIPEVSVNTRKGVVVNYAPCELAV